MTPFQMIAVLCEQGQEHKHHEVVELMDSVRHVRRPEKRMEMLQELLAARGDPRVWRAEAEMHGAGAGLP